MKIPLSPDYIAYKQGILSEEEFWKRWRHNLISTTVAASGSLILLCIAYPVGVIASALTIGGFEFNDHLLAKKYGSREKDIAIEDILSVDTRSRQVLLKGDRTISVTQEQLDMLVELREISTTINYEIIR